MTALKALLFDVDGTLADTERYGHLIAFNKAFQEAKLDWHWSAELYGELLMVTGGKERIRFYIEQYHPEMFEKNDLNSFIANLHKAKTGHYLALLQRGEIPLRAGVERLLTEAREQHLTLAIVTTTTLANVQNLIESTLGADAFEWFAVIAAGDIVSAKKPAADIYIYTLEKLGLAAEQCIAFEDSSNGIRSSAAAGLKTIVTINEYTREQDFSEAVLVLDGFGEPEQAATVLTGTMKKKYLDVERIIELAGQSV